MLDGWVGRRFEQCCGSSQGDWAVTTSEFFSHETANGCLDKGGTLSSVIWLLGLSDGNWMEAFGANNEQFNEPRVPRIVNGHPGYISIYKGGGIHSVEFWN